MRIKIMFEYEEDEYQDADSIEKELAEDNPIKPEAGSLTVTLNFDQYMSGTLHEHIIAKLVISLQERMEAGVKKIVASSVQKIIDSKIEGEFLAIAEKYIEDYLTKPVKRTNTWGEPVGGGISLREMLVTKMETYLNERVDSEGKASSYSSNLKRSEWLIRKAALEPLASATKEKVGEISEIAKKQVQEMVSRYISEQLTPAINVPPLKLDK